jgi:hypothetical protein
MSKTPADEWKDALIQYKKKCQNILEVTPSIRYVGVLNAYGRTLTGIIRPKIKPLLRAEDTKNEFFIVSNLMTLRKNTTDEIGKLEHVLLQHQKVSVVLLQKNNVTYYISIDRKESDIEKIISRIKKII